jgi:hypothetical protein
MFIDPEELIYHSHPTLRYRVHIEILEATDWPDWPDDDDFGRQWPTRTKFAESEGSGRGGGADGAAQQNDIGDSSGAPQSPPVGPVAGSARCLGWVTSRPPVTRPVSL